MFAACRASVVGLLAVLVAPPVPIRAQAPAGPARTDRYGDPLPAAAVARLGTTRFRDIHSWCLVAPGGRPCLLYVGERDAQSLRLCEISSGRPVRAFRAGADERLCLLCACPDGRAVAAHTGRAVRLWDGVTGRRLADLPHDCDDATFTPAGRRLATWQAQRRACLWDVATGRLLRDLRFDPPAGAPDLAVSDDGLAVVAAGRDGIHLWDLETGRERRTLPPLKVEVEELVVAGGGAAVVVVPRGRPGLCLWRAAAGRWQSLPGGKAVGRRTRFGPGGRLLVSFRDEPTRRQWFVLPGDTDRTLALWDVATARQVLATDPPAEVYPVSHTNGLQACALSPDGQRLAVLYAWTIELRDTATGQEVRTLGWLRQSRAMDLLAERVRQAISKEPRRVARRMTLTPLAFAPDGRVVACRDGRALRFWDVASGDELITPRGHTGEVYGLAFSPDGRRLASCAFDRTVRSWDVATTAPRACFDWSMESSTADGLAFTTDGRTLAANGGYAVRLWDARGGRRLRDLTPEDPLDDLMSLAPRPRLAPSVALTADGTTAITTWAERLGIAVWDVRTGKLRRTVCSDAAIHALAVSPTAGLVAAAGRWADSIGGAVAIVDLDTGDVLRSAPNALRLDGHLAFAPDGKLLVSWDGKSADLFEAATLRPVGSFRPRRGEFGAMAITPGGRLLAAEHQSWGANGMLTDGAVQPVDLVAGTPLGRLTGPPMLSTGMAFAPDGTRFAVGSGTSVLLWDLKRLPGAASPAATRVAAAELDRLWGDLAADDAGRAYRAVWTLAAAADQAVAYLAQRLRPAPEPPAVRLIRDLDSPTFAVRQQAATALRALGRDAEPAVRRALENGPSLELRRRAGPLLAELRRRVPEPERLRPLRAVQVLEYAGTEPARRVLEKLAAGAPDAELTREAKAALGRLARRLP